jgi:hypothetical protein
MVCANQIANVKLKQYRKESIMNSYSIIALFLHIVGALGVSLALGLEWIGLRQIRTAMFPEQVRTWMGIFKSVRQVGFISMLTTVITGIYMIMTYWGGKPWIIVTMGSLILVIVLAQALTAPRMAAIGRVLATEKGSVPQTFHKLVNDPILWISIQTRVALILGIIFLKIAKPGLGGSLLTISVAIILGIASVLPMLRTVRVHEVSTD